MLVIVSILVMCVIIALRYLISSGFFAWLTHIRYPRYYKGLEKQVRREIYWSLLSAFVYGVPAGVVAWGWQQHGWTLIYTDLHTYPLWWWPVSVLMCLALHDTWFYWTHRLMHWPPLFRIAHAVHHASRPPTAWAAMAFHPIEALTGAVVVPLLVFIIPLHVSALAVILSVMTLMGITNHMGWEMFPNWMVNGKLGNFLITASHHQQHHDVYRSNYGLYFRFWDRLCGTDRGLGRFARITVADGRGPEREC